MSVGWTQERHVREPRGGSIAQRSQRSRMGIWGMKRCPFRDRSDFGSPGVTCENHAGKHRTEVKEATEGDFWSEALSV